MYPRALPVGFVWPCLPTKASKPPAGELWLHEIKHDGFRVIGRKDGDRVRLYSRPGNDLTRRFPTIVAALAGLRLRSCIIDGEAVACDENGVACFDLIRHHRTERVTLHFRSKALPRNPPGWNAQPHGLITAPTC
jgi:ATP-dependent DNA ligase